MGGSSNRNGNGAQPPGELADIFDTLVTLIMIGRIVLAWLVVAAMAAHVGRFLFASLTARNVPTRLSTHAISECSDDKRRHCNVETASQASRQNLGCSRGADPRGPRLLAVAGGGPAERGNGSHATGDSAQAQAASRGSNSGARQEAAGGAAGASRRRLYERYESAMRGEKPDPAAGAAAAGAAGSLGAAGAQNKARARAGIWPVALFLPEEFAPHWIRAPSLSRFLDRVALLCVAEVTVHVIHAVLLSPAADPLVAALYLAFCCGKLLCAFHQWLLCGSVLPQCRMSACVHPPPSALSAHVPDGLGGQGAAATATQTQSAQSLWNGDGVVLFPLQSTALRLQRRGCLWSVGLIILVCLVVPAVGLHKLASLTAAVSAVCFLAQAWALYEV